MNTHKSQWPLCARVRAAKGEGGGAQTPPPHTHVHLARHTPSGMFVEAPALDGAYSYFYLSLEQISKNGITAQQPLGTMLRLEPGGAGR